MVSHKRTRQELRDAKRQRRMALVLAVLMLLSIFGMWASTQGQEKHKYDGYKLKLEQMDNFAVFTTKVDGDEYYFYTLPSVVLNVSSGDNMYDLLSQASLVVLSTPAESGLGSFADSLRYEFSQYDVVDFAGATLDNSSLSLPVLTCANATALTPVIELQEGNTTSIVSQDNCILIETTSQNLAIVRDRLLYGLVGIITK